MKDILKDLKTEMINLRRLDDVSTMGKEKTNGEPRKQL